MSIFDWQYLTWSGISQQRYHQCGALYEKLLYLYFNKLSKMVYKISSASKLYLQILVKLKYHKWYDNLMNKSPLMFRYLWFYGSALGSNLFKYKTITSIFVASRHAAIFNSWWKCWHWLTDKILTCYMKTK